MFLQPTQKNWKKKKVHTVTPEVTEAEDFQFQLLIYFVYMALCQFRRITI